MTPITVFDQPEDVRPANSMFQYVATVRDVNGIPIAASRMTTMTLSIVDVTSGTILNGLGKDDILNTGRGTLDANGLLTVTLSAADNALHVATDAREQRALVIDWAFGNPAISSRHEVVYTLAALAGPATD